MYRLITALSYTNWFIVDSWSYANPNSFKRKIEFVFWIIPAWFKFTVLIYKAED